MRKLFLILLIAFSFTASAQKADTTKTPKADTTKPKQYFNVAQIEIWQVLYKAVFDPMKVTREELAALEKWFTLVKELPEPKK